MTGRASPASEPDEALLPEKEEPPPEAGLRRGYASLTRMSPCGLEPSAQSNSRTSFTRSCMDGLALPKNIMVLSM